jgi:hypothetical protein
MIGIGFPELCADGTSRLQGLVEIFGGLLLKSGVLSIVPAMALGNPVGRLPSMIVSSASSRSSGSFLNLRPHPFLEVRSVRIRNRIVFVLQLGTLFEEVPNTLD